jgi:pimeloyl-ACP methyl ester carboxylesterase
MNRVAVLIPGIMGSELRLGGQRIWPGPLVDLVLPYKLMPQLLSPDLVATDVIRTYATTTQYKALIDDLGTLGFGEADGSLVIFPYDWRQANEVSAAALADVLDKALEARGNDAEFILLGHSMGGLVARYYLESGKFADRPALARVVRFLALATPHRGAPLAFHRILGQEKALWLSAAQVREAANDPRYPSAYQLMPPPTEPFAWNSVPGAAYASVDLYDPASAEDRGLNRECLEAARAFHAALNPARRPANVGYFCFSGTRQTTVTLAAVRRTATGFEARRVERDDAGDGTVPYWSSTLSGVQCLPVGGEHSVIYKDGELRRTLATLLGRPGAFGQPSFAGPGMPQEVEVSVRDKVIEPGRPVHLVLTPAAPGQTLDGELRVEQAVDPATPTTAYTPVGPPLPIKYQGPAAASFGLVGMAPVDAGAYRFAFYPAGQASPAGADPFVVQKPA